MQSVLHKNKKAIPYIGESLFSGESFDDELVYPKFN